MMVGMDNKPLMLLTESMNLSCVSVQQVNIAIRLLIPNSELTFHPSALPPRGQI